MLSDRFRSYSKKEKLAEIATRCHSMSLDISLVYFYKRSIESALIEFKVYWKQILVETRITMKPNQ